MSHHVRIRVIHDDQPETLRKNRVLRQRRHFRRRHLRLQIVSRHLRTRRDSPLLQRKRLLPVIVEEERHVRIFFRLRATELRNPPRAHVFAQNVLHLLRLRKQHLHRQTRLVLRHRDEEKIELRPALEPIELIQNERLADFSRTISPIIVKQNRVAVRDVAHPRAIRIQNPRRQNKLVALTRRIQRIIVILLHRRLRAERRRLRAPPDQTVISFLHSLPAIVPVHAPETPANCRDPSHPDLPAFRFHLPNKLQAARRTCVTPIRKRVNQNVPNPLLLQNLQQPVKMIQHPVHARIGNDPHQMKPSALLPHPLDRRREHRRVFHFPLLQRLVDPDQFLIHNPPGADVLVPHLAVAHDPFRQSDIETRGRQFRHRIPRAHRIVARSPRDFQRVEFILIPVVVGSPTVADNK